MGLGQGCPGVSCFNSHLQVGRWFKASLVTINAPVALDNGTI